ncbi:unnamed protein product [Prorocentrum cordatum]|uniref:PX domain-containing protein n=1 Tax=Prorocentrum cordatum TaxID=2364126 RepID=A0ABN9U8F3_9DINO|nr:unnamed protein product [Polarella glacialis]
MDSQEPAGWASAEVLGHMPAAGHTVYMIKVTGLDGRAWTIDRRYRHIQALHEQLRCVHGSAMPEIPGKRMFGNMNPAFIQEREAGLQRYFAELVRLEQDTRSPAFAQFLAGGAGAAGISLPPGGRLSAADMASIRSAMGAEESEEAQLRRALAMSQSDADGALRRQQEQELEESERVDRERARAAAEELARGAAEAEARARREEAAREQAAAAREARGRLRREAAARLPGEPGGEEAGRVDVQVRLRGGRQLRRALRSGDALRCVYDLVLSELGDDEPETFQLVEAMPRRVHADRDQSLADAGLRGRCALLVEPLDE